MDDFAEWLPYRLAFGTASRLVEADECNTAAGRYRGRSTTDAARLMAEVRREHPGVDPETIAEAVDDVLAGRRPRW